MAKVDAAQAPGADPRSAVVPTLRSATGPVRWLWWDLAAVVAFVAAAVGLTGRLLLDLPGRALSANKQDQAFFEWMLAHGVRVVTHLDNPFVTTRLNMPDGVNLMANTSILGLSIPLAPLTMLFGTNTSFVALLAGAFAATGIAWYYVLSRHVVESRVAALIGAGWCAFAPGMVSHGNGHPNIVAQFLIPFIVLWTMRLREPGRALRNGVILGLLITWQAFINEEILLLTALGLGIFTLGTALLRPDLRRQARPFVTGLGVAALVAAILLAYPLWVQFFGPGAYHGLRPDIRATGADLASFPAFARESLAGGPTTDLKLALNRTEENTFLGWPLLLLLPALVWLLRRNRTALALAATVLAFATASLGPKVRWYGEAIAPSPWTLLDSVPVFDSIVPTRMALAIIPPIGILLALAWDHGWKHAEGWRRYALPVAFAAALLPVAPTPLPDLDRPPTPALFTDGRLVRYVPDDRSVVFVPSVRSQTPDPMIWAAESGLAFRLSHGYFLGPVRNPARPRDRYAIFTSPPRPTSDLLNKAHATGVVPNVTGEMRRQALEDLRYWRAAVVVLVPGRNADALHHLTTELTGVEPERIDDVWVWDVRQAVG